MPSQLMARSVACALSTRLPRLSPGVTTGPGLSWTRGPVYTGLYYRARVHGVPIGAIEGLVTERASPPRLDWRKMITSSQVEDVLPGQGE